jgi:hypothetical protein
MHKYLIVVALILFFGCKENSTESSGNLTAETITSSYTGITHIVVSIKNETKKVVYFTHCNGDIGVYIERKDSVSWVDGGSIAINCSANYPSGAIPIEPMQSMVDTILFSNQSGTYHLKYPYSWQQDGRNQEYVFSNEFTYYNPR